MTSPKHLHSWKPFIASYPARICTRCGIVQDTCAYPNDRDGEHDHDACLDALDDQDALGIQVASALGMDDALRIATR